MTTTLTGKTPKTFLVEHLAKNKNFGGTLSQAKFIDINDPNKPPLWKASCILENYKGQSYKGFDVALNQKEAEHSACLTILRKIGAIKASKLLLDQEDKMADVIKSNYIGKVQEKCRENGWPMPEYIVDSDDTGPTGIVHGTICSVANSFITTGTSKNQKHCKHLAAYKMFTKLEIPDLVRLTQSTSNSPTKPKTNNAGPSKIPTKNSVSSKINGTLPKPSKVKPSNPVPKPLLNSSSKGNSYAAKRVQQSIYYYSELQLAPNVFKGYFETENVKAAVKKMDNSSQCTNFRETIREIKILQKIKHPYLVQYFSSENDSISNCYIAMEFAEHGTLDDYVKKHKPDLNLKKKILKDVLNGLEYLHLGDKNTKPIVVHRDIKPQNILLFKIPGNSEPVAKIADFGISKLVKSDTIGEQTMVKYTLNWAAPETLTSTSKMQTVTTKTDIFSMGIVIFYVLANRSHPFENHLHILSSPPNWKLLGNPRESYCVQDLLEQMLKKNLDERLITATQVKAHPFFWESSQNLAFITAIVNDFTSDKNLNSASLNAKYKHEFKEWNGRLCQHVQNFLTNKHKINKKVYSTNSVVKLIEFIRDKNQHYEEIKSFPNLFSHEVFGKDGKKYMEYFTNHFPELITFLFNYFKRETEPGTKIENFFSEFKC